RLVDAESTIQTLLPQLEEAHLAMDFPQAEGLLKQIDSVCKRLRLPLAGQFKEHVDTVRAWVRERSERAQRQRDFEDACVSLQEGLDRDMPTPELERRFRATVTFAEELPEQLERQYRRRLEERAKRSQRRLVVATSAIAGIALVSIVIGGLWFYRSSHSA